MKSFRLINQEVKRTCLAAIMNLPVDPETPLVVTIKESNRSLAQNDALWRLLECFSVQLSWPVNGQMIKLEAEEWKHILSAAFKNETQRVAMGLDGGMVMLGQRTSKMTKKQFSEFLEFIQAIGAERGVNFE